MMTTNRDLYINIHELTRSQYDNSIELETYLRTLFVHTEKWSNASAIPHKNFMGLLEASFVPAPVPFDEAWLLVGEPERNDAECYDDWKKTLIRQIVDLREMAETGILDKEGIWFGTDSPRGNRWYNFSPVDYLSCAAAGCFGYWPSDHDDGDDDVFAMCINGEPIEVVFEGAGESSEREWAKDREAEIASCSWKLFGDFIECGRLYE